MGVLTGQTALVTGAARGQGRAHAITLAREGANVIAVDICQDLPTVPYPLATEADLDETVAQIEGIEGRALPVVADTRSRSQVEAAVAAGLAEFGAIDILIANAGIWAVTPFHEISEDDWDEMIGVNLTGVFNSARAVTPHMRERNSGAIVLISSINGLETGVVSAHYTAAKHGVIGLMRNIAYELAPYGIRCNAICPGAVNTQMNEWQGALDLLAGHLGGTMEERVQAGHSYHALAGTGLIPPQSIAEVALFLVSSAAEHVTGTVLPVDAGHMILPGFTSGYEPRLEGQ